jgi:hypothetical protein
VLAKMKIATGGRWLWTRTIGSTIIGQALDSAVFITLAFAGTIPSAVLASAIVTQWLVKSVCEALATPLTYAVVNFLKRAEGIDHYDLGTRFNPFRITCRLRDRGRTPGRLQQISRITPISASRSVSSGNDARRKEPSRRRCPPAIETPGHPHGVAL